MRVVHCIRKPRELLVVLANETWSFQLFAHVYQDQSSIKEKTNEAQTKTTIELTLIKQQPRTRWPQLHSYNSTPVTPHRPDHTPEVIDSKTSSSISTLPVYQISTKKLITDFSETDETARWYIFMSKVSSCDAKFTETNFTITFQTKFVRELLEMESLQSSSSSSSSDERFLQEHGVSSKQLIKLFIRVKERIAPEQCTASFTSSGIEIFLRKAILNRSKWTRLEANEYSEMQTPVKSSLMSSGSNITTKTGEMIETRSPSFTEHLSSRSLDTSFASPVRFSNLSPDHRQVECPFETGSLVTMLSITVRSLFLHTAEKCLVQTVQFLYDWFHGNLQSSEFLFHERRHSMPIEYTRAPRLFPP